MLVRNMKNPGEKIGNDVWCDLPPEALEIIVSMPKISEEIFPYSTDAIGAGFTRACQFSELWTYTSMTCAMMAFRDCSRRVSASRK